MYPVSDSLSIAARERIRVPCSIRSRPSNRIGGRLVVLANCGAHQGTRIRGALGDQAPLLGRQDVLRRNRLLGCGPKLRLVVVRHLPLREEKDLMRVLLVSTHVDQTTG